MQFADTLDTAQQIIVNFGLKLLGAFALWWAGRWLIGLAVRLIQKAPELPEQ